MLNQVIFNLETPSIHFKNSIRFAQWFVAMLLLCGMAATPVKMLAEPPMEKQAISISPLEMGIIVPAYIYPSGFANPGEQNNPDWTRLVAAAQVLGDRLVVIANPSNGPGTSADANYTAAINSIRAAGGKVIGYVFTCLADTYTGDPSNLCYSRDLSDMHTDVDRWYSIYNIDGIFLDQASPDAAHVQWYQNFQAYVRGKSSTALVCQNFGVQPNSNFFSIDALSCVYENYTANFDAGVNFSYMTTAQKEKAVVLLHSLSTGTWKTRFQTLQNAGIKWFYITNDPHDPDYNPWDTLPTFFEEMVAAIANSLLDNFKKPTGTQEFQCDTWQTPSGNPPLSYPQQSQAASPPTRKCWIDYNTATSQDINTNLLLSTGNPVTILERRTDFAAGTYSQNPQYSTFNYINCNGDDCDLQMQSAVGQSMVQVKLRYGLPSGSYFGLEGFQGARLVIKENNKPVYLNFYIYDHQNRYWKNNSSAVTLQPGTNQVVNFMFEDLTSPVVGGSPGDNQVLDKIKSIMIMILGKGGGDNFVFDKIEMY
ncbi:MAG: spherulation-specific family 4 protein [Lewinellaceae bacterium]|nr:spherulation-specific family 4 protein [Lewinellaceae bacterium]